MDETEENKDYICKVVATLWIGSGIVFFISLIEVSDVTMYSFFSALFFKVILIGLATSDNCG